jgi:hypothetical protein
MPASYELTRRVISLGMTHPGLLTALIVAAAPKQIAMASQMVNSESHILRPPSGDTLFDALNPNPIKTPESRIGSTQLTYYL